MIIICILNYLVGIGLIAMAINTEKFIFILLIASFSLLFFNTIFLLRSILEWWCYTSDTAPKFTFKQFITLYTVIPDKFKLEDHWIIYNNGVSYAGTRIDFKTYTDYFRYHMFCEHKESYDLRQKQIQNQALLIKDLQQDLAREQAKADCFIKENIIK